MSSSPACTRHQCFPIVLSCSVLFCSPAVLDPRVGHAMDVLASVSEVYYYYFSAVAAERDSSWYAPPAPPAVCRYLLPAGRSAANPPLLLSNDGTDRQTDRRLTATQTLFRRARGLFCSVLQPSSIRGLATHHARTFSIYRCPLSF